MKVIINIPMKTYQEIRKADDIHCGEKFAQKLLRYVKNGTPIEQELHTDTLDKIRGEIEGLKICVALDEEGEFWYRDALNDAIEIIDKYIDRGMRGVI